MNIIGWLLAGALIAWMGRSIIHTDAQMGIILNVIVGVIAAGLAGWLLSPLVGVSTISAFRTRWRERPRWPSSTSSATIPPRRRT
jgi:uncharacterized membrane protein YeaQ/YmgE (transglycosylase-associated protein family)